MFTSFLKIWCEVYGLTTKNWAANNPKKLSPRIHGQLLSATDMSLSLLVFQHLINFSYYLLLALEPS